MTNETYMQIMAEKAAKKAESRKRSAAKSIKTKAHKQAVAEYEAAQVGPFTCHVCKAAHVEKFGVICPSCAASIKVQARDWYAAKPQVVGVFA